MSQDVFSLRQFEQLLAQSEFIGSHISIEWDIGPPQSFKFLCSLDESRHSLRHTRPIFNPSGNRAISCVIRWFSVLAVHQV